MAASARQRPPVGWQTKDSFQNSSELRYIKGKDEPKGSTAVREGNVRDVVGVRGYTTALGSPLWHGIPSSDIGRSSPDPKCKERGMQSHVVPTLTQRLRLSKLYFFLNARRRWAITGTPFLNEYTDTHSLPKFLRLKPCCVDELFQRYFLKPSKDRMFSEVLMLLPNKVLVAALQSLAIRRERGSTFNNRPITDTQDPVIHWIELILDDGIPIRTAIFLLQHSHH